MYKYIVLWKTPDGNGWNKQHFRRCYTIQEARDYKELIIKYDHVDVEILKVSRVTD